MTIQALDKKIWSLNHVGLPARDPRCGPYVVLRGRYVLELGPSVDLRLTMTAVQALVVGGHLPDWPKPTGADWVSEGDGQHALRMAVARWYVEAVNYAERLGYHAGTGYVFHGRCTADDAARILAYLDGVAGSMLAAGTAAIRRQGQVIETVVDQAVDHLRSQGVKVDESDRRRGTFTITAPDD